jgi:hydroxypyruvate isomerase
MVSKLVSIKLRPEQYNYAKAQARKQGVSLSAYLRNITIGEVIKGTWPIPSCNSGHHNNMLTISMLDEVHKILDEAQKKILAIAQDMSND